MVHALEKVHSLLKPKGILVDMQEIPYRRRLEVQMGGQIIPLGDLPSKIDFEDVKRGHQALVQVVDGGFFVSEGERVFEGCTHAESLAEMREFWDGLMVNDRQQNRIEDIISQAELQTTVVVRETVRLTRLRSK